MGKFQLNKKGEDPIKIYEDTFKIANDTVETYLDKLGKMPKPISREVGDTEDRVTKSYINQLDTVLNLLEDEELAKPHETLNVLDQFKQVEAIASEGKDAYGNYDAYSMPPASGYTGRDWDGRSDIEQQTDVDQKIKNVLDYEKESLASEDYGNMNTVQNPNLDTDGYPMDQEGFTRASWDDASIQDRKNWLFVAGYDSERGDEYEPYFSLDSHIRAQLAKDLQIGGIYAMGTGSL